MSVKPAQLKISDAEYRVRCNHLLDALYDEHINGVALFDSDYILYYTGFRFIPTERPIGFIMNAAGERVLFVPRLELEHARANAQVDRVESYIEYPDTPHPMKLFAELLNRQGILDQLAVDEDGYPRIFGYRGPTLTELGGWQVFPIRAFIEDQIAIKSEAEVALFREGSKWANFAHRLLQKYTVVGVTEAQVDQRASYEANQAMLDAIGPIYRPHSTYYNSIYAGYRGQIGRNAAIPHTLANNIMFQAGDVLVSEVIVPIWGYHVELERTMILGKPSDEQKRFYDHMLSLQEIAFRAIEPGKPCSEVDIEVRRYYEKHDLANYWKHHSGHAIGLRYHEGPFLDAGDHTIIRPGMVFTVEPGLYVPSVGGFRHSDTVLVSDDGVELLTFYPRDIESLTLPV